MKIVVDGSRKQYSECSGDGVKRQGLGTERKRSHYDQRLVTGGRSGLFKNYLKKKSRRESGVGGGRAEKRSFFSDEGGQSEV